LRGEPLKNPFKSRKVPTELAAWNETIQLAMNRPVNLKNISTSILESIAQDSIENEILKVLAITEKIGMESEMRNIFVSTIRALLQIDEQRAISFAIDNTESYGDERSTRSIIPALIRSGDLQGAELLIQTVDDNAYQQRILSDINEARKLLDPIYFNKKEYYESIKKGELNNARHFAIQYSIHSPGSEADHRLKYINSLLKSLTAEWIPELNSSKKLNGQVIPNKILHLHKVSYPFESTGGAIRNMDVVKAQKHAGLDPFVVTPLNYPRIFDIEEFPLCEEISGIRHLRIDLGSNNSKSMQHITANLQMNTEMLAGIIRNEQPALIHAASGYKGYELAVMAESLSRHFGIPWIYEVRSFHEHTWTNDPKYAMNSEHTRLRIEKENSLMKKAECVVTISESMKQAIIERGIEPDSITIVPNAVDRYRFKPLQRNEALQLELGLKDSFTLGYISNMSLREGHDILIKAIPTLIKEHRNVKLLLVGDGKERENLEKLVEELKIQDRVIFTGNVDHSKIQEYYALIDLFVVPRRQDYASDLVTPLKPFEAMAMKIPLLVSDRPALLEIIGEDRGFSFRTEDSQHLAEMISQFINNPNKAAIRVENAAKWISESRTWEHNAQIYTDLYCELANSNAQ
jgi:glycosyltransferase involved in cell wall biosynthesis